MSHRTNTSAWLVFRYPFDLAVVSIGTLIVYVIVTAFGSDSLMRLAVTFPLALFLPGYAVVSVLFPARNRRARETASTSAGIRPRGIDGVERLGLSFVLSLAVVPLVVLVLPLTEWGLTTTSITAGLSVGTIVIAQLGVVRRLRTPDSERFRGSLTAALECLRRNDGGGISASSVFLVFAVGMAGSALFMGFLMPAETGGFTELALYSEDEDGEMVTGRLPSEIESGESIPFILSIENQEGKHQDYTVVVQQHVVVDGDVAERTELQRINASLSDGATGTGERSVTPTVAPNETVRISFLLYHGDPPDEPTIENADRETHFWVAVTDGGSSREATRGS